MKRSILSLILVLCMIFSLAACNIPGIGSTVTPCQHRDINDDGICDRCDTPYTDGKDVITPCQHRDKDDDGECDKCEGAYSDGKDVFDTCQHRDADDNNLCDKCNESYTDGKDVFDNCQHRDANDDNKCDKCTQTYSDGTDIVYSKGLEFVSNGDGTCSVAGIGTCTDTNLFIPPTSPAGDSVTTIGIFAFDSCNSLTSVGIPDSITSIGSSAFYSCDSLTSIIVSEGNTAYQSIDGNLYSKDGKTLIQYAIGKKDTSFEIPDSVTVIGLGAFIFCDSLTSVVIGDSVTSIGKLAFFSCDSLTSVVIGDSVTTIGDDAFHSCYSLTSVVIPDSVTTIGWLAFAYCKKLTSIKYRGTQSQWNAISKGSYWNSDTGSYTITYNYTGK